MFAYLNKLLDGINKSIKLRSSPHVPTITNTDTKIDDIVLTNTIREYLSYWQDNPFTIKHIGTVRDRAKILKNLELNIENIVINYCKSIYHKFNYNNVEIYTYTIANHILSPYLYITVRNKNKSYLYSHTFIIDFLVDDEAVVIDDLPQSSSKIGKSLNQLKSNSHITR